MVATLRCGIPIALLEGVGLELCVIDMLEEYVGLGIDDLLRMPEEKIISISGMGSTRYQHLRDALDKFADIVSMKFDSICHEPLD